MRAIDSDERFMRLALAEARKGAGKTSPNPAVGAVVVRDGNVLAKGYHKRAGEPHAEVVALEKINYKARGCTLYVTLEPCNHYGRTPPCTHAILRAGVSRVVVGMEDPNPDVKGGGCRYLEEHGVQVKVGVLEAECRRLNEAYIKFVTTRRPFVLLKIAATLDGWMATSSGNSKWITGPTARRYVHRLRQASDAVMVGVGTVIKDDPLLTARDVVSSKRQPLRIVVDTGLRSPLDAKIFTSAGDIPTTVVVGMNCKTTAKLKSLEKMGVSIVRCPVKGAVIDLNALMDILGGMEIQSLLVEGGARLNYSLIREKLVDKIKIFLAPKVLAGGDGLPIFFGKGPGRIEDCLNLKELSIRRFDHDLLVTAYPNYEHGEKVNDRP